MRKLRVVLVLLCAMLVSVGLFACKKKPKPQETGTEISSVTGVENIPTITDSDNEEAVRQKINGITVSYRAGSTRGTVKGSECEIMGEITYQKVGTYTLTVQPKENNPKEQNYTFSIKIVHDFGEEDANGVATCRHDGARRVASEEDIVIHYGSFHQGTQATLPSGVYEETKVVTYGDGKEATSYVKPFGTVEAFFNGRTEAHTVPTLTVGDLEPGTTITVRGTAQTAWENWKVVENAYYYFPVIGFADPYMNNAEFDGTTHKTYVGGTSVFVRGEGWVLYNGVGDTTSGPRMLASLSGGQSESINYGSWKDAFASETNPVPNGYVNGEMPAPDSASWHDWWVYSSGDGQLNSGDYYQDETPIELVWTYREDGIIELQYNYNYKSTTNAVSLVAYIKVPISTRGFYRTMLHGDYVDMTVTEYERIETLTPSEFRFNAESTGTIVAYEGAMLDAGALKTEFKYVQTGDVWQPYTVVSDNVYATTDETVTEGTEWVSLGKAPLSTKYNNYKIELEKAGKPFGATIPKANIKVVPNAIGEAFGSDVTIGGVTFGNNRKVGAFALGANAEGTALTLALQGAANYAQALSADQKAKFTDLAENTEYRYVALRLTNNELKQFTTTGVSVKSGAADVPYLLEIQDGDAHLVLALTEETANAGVTIEGLNGTPVNVTFANLNGFKITAQVSPATSGKLNEGGSVTFTFTAVAGSTLSHVQIGASAQADLLSISTLVDVVKDAGESGFVYEGKTITEATLEGQSFTLTIKFPAANISDYASCFVGASIDGIRSDIVEEIHYDFDFAEEVEGDKGAVLADGMYAYVEKGVLTIVGALPASADITELVGQNAAEFNLNINAGDKENIRLLDLSFAYSAEEEGLVFTDAANLPAGIAIRSNTVAGIGTLVYFEIDAAKLGFTGAYAFEPFYGNGNTYYTVENGEVKAVEVADKGDKKIIVDGNCIDAGIVANEIKKENEVIFYLNPASVGGEHIVKGGVCTLCGAAVSKVATNGNWYGTGVSNVALNENDLIEVTGVYTKAGNNLDGTMAVVIREYNGSKLVGRFSLNGNGFAEYREGDWGASQQPYAEGVEGFMGDFTRLHSSLITEEYPYNTLNGKLDGDGNAISASTLHEAMVNGTFRYTISYQSGAIVVRMRLYKENVPLDGTPYFDYYYTCETLPGATYDIQGVWGQDSGKITLQDGNVNYYKGKISNSVISGAVANEITIGSVKYSSPELSIGSVALDGGLAKIALSGMAKKQDVTVNSNAYTHFAAFTLNFSQALVASTTVSISGVTDATVQLAADRESMIVFIPVKDGVNVGTATISVENQEASTMQCDIQIDLSNVIVSDIVATPDTSGLYVNGGSFTIAYTGAITGASISVNGGTAATLTELSNTDLGDVTATYNNGTVTFTTKAVDFKSALKTYTVTLTKDGKTLGSNVVSSTAIKAEDQVTENVFVSANGTELTFVFTNAAFSTQDFYLNANNGYAMADKTLLDSYKLNFTLAENGKISFATRNLLTTATTAVYTKIGNNNVVALTVDLSKLGIAADTAYGFEAAIGTGTVAYRTVSAARAITAMSINTDAAAAVVLAATCKVEGVNAKAVGEGNDAIFYYGFERTYADHAFEDGVCGVCGAVQISGTISEANWTVAKEKLANVAENGLTVSFLLSSGAAGDWNTKAVKIAGYDAVISSANLSIKNNGLGELDTSKLPAGADADHPGIKEKAEALKEVNGGAAYPGYVDASWGDAYTEANAAGFNPWAADQMFEASTADKTVYNYVTVTVSKTGGIQYYIRGQLVLEYQGTRFAKPFAELFLLMAQEYGIEIATLGLEAVNATVLPYSISTYAAKAMYDSYVAEAGKHQHVYDPETDRCTAEGCPVAGGALKPGHEHSFSENHVCRCGERNAPVYSENQTATTENPIVIGTTDNAAPYPGLTPTWTTELKRGEKLVFTGTHTSKAAANYQTVFAYLFSGLAPQGLFRADWWVLDGGNAGAGADMAKAEGWAIAKVIGPNWDTFKNTLNGSLVVTYDWSNPNAIIVRFDFSNGTDSNTMSYTVTPAESFTQNFYSVGLACESSSFTINSIERTTPEFNPEPATPSENQTNPTVGTSDKNLGFTNLTPVWIGNSFSKGEKVTITGTLASAGNRGWESPIAYIMSSKEVSVGLRGDGFVFGTPGVEAIKIVSDPAVATADKNYPVDAEAGVTDENRATQDTEYLNLIKDCTFTLVYDWTGDNIVVTLTYAKDTVTRTTTFTITSTFEFADEYWIGLGGENIYLQVSSIVKTPATTPEA